MTFNITLKPSNHSFPVEAGETILEAALKYGYTLPYSCREGVCGVCKGRVLQGTVDHGLFQEFALNATERAAGMALFCCAMPESDLVIESREISTAQDIPVRAMPCRVQKMEKVTDDVIVLYLKLPSSERMQFLAGQYINILTKEGKQHSFSLGNAPHDDEFLQLHIRMIPGGAFTHHVFTQMKELDILRIKGPLGTFFLREDSAKPALFIASGTGIAPVKAIIEHALYTGLTGIANMPPLIMKLAMPVPLSPALSRRAREIRSRYASFTLKRSMHVYWGVRKQADLYLLDLAQRWEAHGIRFTPVLSEPLAEDHWQGKTGYVHQAVMEDYSDLSGHQVYACGGPMMVAAAHRDFTTLRGLPEDEFFSDSFTPAPKS